MLEKKSFFFFRNTPLQYLYYPSYKKEKKIAILFFHANGFPTETYREIFLLWQKEGYSIWALNMIGHGDSGVYLNFSSWIFLGEIARSFFLYIKKRYPFSFFLVGHSLGGAMALYIAGKEISSRIRGVIALDPVVLTFTKSFMALFLTSSLEKGARKRREEFSSLYQIESLYRRFPTFRNWEEKVWKDYLMANFFYDKRKKKYFLKSSKEVEAKIFSTISPRMWIYYKKVSSPLWIYISRGSYVCPEKSAKKLIKNHPFSFYRVHPWGGHFFPMEDPYGVSKWALAFFQVVL